MTHLSLAYSNDLEHIYQMRTFFNVCTLEGFVIRVYALFDQEKMSICASVNIASLQ